MRGPCSPLDAAALWGQLVLHPLLKVTNWELLVLMMLMLIGGSFQNWQNILRSQ